MAVASTSSPLSPHKRKSASKRPSALLPTPTSRDNSAGHEVVFLPRHARGHKLLPSEIPHRANLHGFKQLGVKWIISISAVGSLQHDYAPGDVVLPDQFFDRTKGRTADTFFGEGIVAHVAFGDPISPELQDVLHVSAQAAGAKVHKGGTYVNIEGPQFSTRAESETYRSPATPSSA